ncbi:MAG: hypothetical protein ACRDRF_14470, partial [Pseudonocardiaceae bacterium]
GCPQRELAVGWALHVLEPAGESLAAAHLPDCTVCTTTAAQTEEVGATLGLSLPEAIPRAELEQRILGVTSAGWKARRITKPSWLRIGSWWRP